MSNQRSEQLDLELETRMARLAERHATESNRTTPTRKTASRRHPAKKSRLAALSLSLMTTVWLTARFLNSENINPAIATPTGQTASAASSTGDGGTSSQTVSSPVVGDTYSNRFGVVQVQAVFGSDGSITDVQVVQAPNHNWQSARISSLAVPMLNSEALTTQSAQVDTISGATYTSVSYQRSLQSAIDQARSEGLTQLT